MKVLNQHLYLGKSETQFLVVTHEYGCLIALVFEFGFWGTPVVAVNLNKNFVPKCISDCLTVRFVIANNQTNTESDVLVFSEPEHQLLRLVFNRELLGNHINTRLNVTDLIVLQCKTNWNDNSQIPNALGYDLQDI